MATSLDEIADQPVSSYRVVAWRNAAVVTVTYSSHQGRWYAPGGEAVSSSDTAVPSHFASWGSSAFRLQRLNEAFDRLQADPERWAAYQADFADLDGTTADGLPADEDEEWDESLTDAASW